MIDKNFVEDCLKEALFLQGRLVSLNEEKESIYKRVEEAKIWLGKQPDYLKFLQHLQNILHQKNIGTFSELLSYFVKDVLNKDKEIIFDLYTYHNLPALKIEALNNGCKESIIEGNGGSIANIVSTGLRLIALSRLNHRKFIVLDEPDCWLKPDHVPVFAKIIGEISSQLNIQTVIISHHHWSYFKDYGRVIELKLEGPHLTTEIIHDTPVSTENLKHNIIKKIVLSKFMSHYETVYELHPHLTCIIGENDIGKSVLATALKAVSYADSSDSYIMHYEKSAKVLIETSDNNMIMWERFLQTDQDNPQKVKYTLFNDEFTNGISEFSSNETPQFINEKLNICTTEDIDVHIGNQKQPVFLLSSDTKPQQRAKLLSLGKESLIIQKMMENIKSKTRQNKQTVKEGEERYAIVERLTSELGDMQTIVDNIESLKEKLFILNKQKETIDDLKQTIESIEQISCIASMEKIESDITPPQLHHLGEINYVISEYQQAINISKIEKIKDIDAIKLHDTKDLHDTISNLSKIKALSLLEPIEKIESNISLIDTKEIHRAIALISEWNYLANIEPITEEIQKPTLKPIEDLKLLILEMEKQEAILVESNKKKDILKNWETQLAKEDQEYINKYGSVCPTCQQHITAEHIKGITHA